MKEHLYVILDGLFTRTDGRPSSNHLGYEHFAKRYLSVFDDVTIMSRIGERVDENAKPIDGPNVKVLALPDIRAMLPFLLYLPKLILILFKLPRESSYVLRIPGFITTIASFVLYLRRIPFGVEVVADPADALGSKAFKHPLQFLLKPFQTIATRFQCKVACSTAYVTEQALQRRYPPKNNKPTFNYTSLDLHDEMFREERTLESFNTEQPVIVNVAMMQKTIKGQDVLLHAFKQVRDAGIDAKLVLIGDGDHKGFFESLASELDLSDNVRFTGLLPKGEKLFNELDRADLFVLASRQEGLPRAMIEAMSRSLPCVSTDVGGADELIDRNYLVDIDDIDALSKKMIELLKDRPLLFDQSSKNRSKAEKFHVLKVQPVREDFYTAVLKSKISIR